MIVKTLNKIKEIFKFNLLDFCEFEEVFFICEISGINLFDEFLIEHSDLYRFILMIFFFIFFVLIKELINYFL